MCISLGTKKENVMLSWILIHACRNDGLEPTFHNLLIKTKEFKCEEWYGIKPERAAARARQIWRNHV